MRRIFLDQDIKPLSEFRAGAAKCIAGLRESKRPLVITRRGKSAAVVLDVGVYEGLLEKLELLQDVQTAKQQIEAGREISHEAARDQVLQGIGK